MSLIELEQVGVDYADGPATVHALSEVDLSIEEGTTTAIVGRSGSGKSTLVSVLGMLRRPTRGRILVRGRDVTHVSPRLRADIRGATVGFMFQSFHLEPTLSVLDNVLVPWYLRHGTLSRTAARARAAETLDSLGLGGKLGRRPSQLSGGERQRVAFARSLLNNPEVIIADEPTGNLDEATALRVSGLLLGFAHDDGRSVVVVTHDVAIASLADRVLHLVEGSLVEDGARRAT